MRKRYNENEYLDELDDNEDLFSPTAWERAPFESDEDYLERMQDQEDWLESFDD